jgi:hypothetical protein
VCVKSFFSFSFSTSHSWFLSVNNIYQYFIHVIQILQVPGRNLRFANLESLDESFDINNAWESIRENIKTSARDNLGYHRLKHNKSWFDDECSKLIDQQKQAKLQWLQNPSQINGDNLKTLRCETSRTCRRRKGNI